MRVLRAFTVLPCFLLPASCFLLPASCFLPSERSEDSDSSEKVWMEYKTYLDNLALTL